MGVLVALFVCAFWIAAALLPIRSTPVRVSWLLVHLAGSAAATIAYAAAYPDDNDLTFALFVLGPGATVAAVHLVWLAVGRARRT